MTEQGHNNPPDVVLELTREEAEFALENAETNISQGLAMLQTGTMSRPTAEKLVKLIENFKPLRAKLREALKE